MIENSLKTNCYVSQRPKFEVRVDFPIGNEVKEKIMEKNDLKKIYAFLRIYSTENNYILFYFIPYHGVEYKRILIYLYIEMNIIIIIVKIY